MNEGSCSLRQLLAREGRLSPASALGVLLQVLDSLEVIHDSGSLHGDLRLDSIWVSAPDAGTLLVDVPAGRGRDHLRDAARQTAAPSLYLPPEAQSGAEPNESWDLYAAGRLLLQLLAGPDCGPDDFTVQLAAAGICDTLIGVVARALGTTRDNRYAWASEFRQALRDAEVSELPAGTVIDGRYRVEERLSLGRRSVVYRVLDRDTRQLCALKILVGSAGTDEEAQRFAREAKLGRTLEHVNLVRVHQTGHWLQHPYLTMDLVDGMVPLLDAWPRLTWPALLDVFEQAANALDYLAGQGIVHRDVSPSNLLVGGGGQVKLIDLGYAGVPESALTRASRVSLLGSAGYVPPEQFDEPQTAGPASDQWALAAIVYQSLTGIAPYFGADASDQAAQEALDRMARGERLATPRELNGTVSDKLSAVVMRALAENPRGRFTTCVEFVYALRRAAPGELALPFFDPLASP